MKKILLFPLRILAWLCLVILLLPVFVGIAIIGVIVILIALITAVSLVVLCPIAYLGGDTPFVSVKVEREKK